MRKKKKGKVRLRQRISQTLALPEDVLLDLPRITLCGNRELEVENFKNILEYLESSIALNCSDSILRLTGSKLEITSITDDFIHVKGNISSVSFTK